MLRIFNSGGIYPKAWAICKELSRITGKTPFYHFIDLISTYVMHGVTIREYKLSGLYRYRNYDRKKVVTYRRWIKIIKTFNDAHYIHFLEDKADFDKHFSRSIKRDWMATRTADEQDIRNFISKYGQVIVKPNLEMQGHGIHIIDAFHPKYIGSDYIMEEIIQQHGEMCFNNKSVNTLRVYTVLDANGEPHIIKALLRAGCGDSIVDNLHASGGRLYPVDDKTGIITGGGFDVNYTDEVYVHPGTDILMIGRRIPNWTKVVELAKQSAKKIPQVRFIGWDIAVLKDDVELVEGNHNPDLEFLEFIGTRCHYKRIMSYR